MPCWRQHPDFHHEPGRGRRQYRVHATRDGAVHLAPLQAQREGYPSHGNAPVRTQAALLPVAGLEEVAVFVPADSGIDAGTAAPQPVRIQCSVFQGLCQVVSSIIRC